MRCSYCQAAIIRNLTLKEIFLPWRVTEYELCKTCRQQFVYLKTKECCPRCMHQEPGLCSDCCDWQQAYPGYDFAHRALFTYEEAFSQWLAAYKFIGDYRLRRTFAQEVRQSLREYRGFIICPLPLAKERFEERGFNQTTGFLQAAEINYQELIRRVSNELPQSKKKRQERLALTQPYALQVAPQAIQGKKILLVDDVYTTGRTMFHAAEVILAEKPELVRSFSLAR